MHVQIAELVVEIDPEIPMTLLALFPCYSLPAPDHRPPTVHEMIRSYTAMKEAGLNNLRLGNKGVFVKSDEDRQILIDVF
jgi:pyruvate-formate lyase-activating enzyme